MESKQFINSIIDTMPLAVFVKDTVNLRYVFWNKYAETLVGFTADEILGKTDYELFPNREANLFTSRDKEVINTKAVLEVYEDEIYTKFGNEHIYLTCQKSTDFRCQ
jgi:two-component system NtrC family sensor kinase